MPQSDPLLALRASIATDATPILSSSSDPSDTSASTTLAQATHIHFLTIKASFSLDADTRFRPADKTIDLRSIYFAWIHRDASIQDYLSSVQMLNAEMSAAGGSGAHLQSLPFAERLDLTSWLSGAQDESDYIMPLAPDAMDGKDLSTRTADYARPIVVDARLEEIYSHERRILDRTSILHGAKPMDFSSVRKVAMAYLGRSTTSKPTTTSALTSAPSAALVTGQKKPSRRPDPIILLSPSASALLRMSNIKRFLEEGVFVPADSELAPNTGATRLQVSRSMPSLDPSRPLRFHVVDSPDTFKPEHWSRLVAVFTTGQAWQFKSYKWSSPLELFARVLGIYVGWSGESVPDAVKGWGRSVRVVQVEKWNSAKGESGRWRDREAVEGVWESIEEGMRARGWGKEGGVS